MNKQRFLCYILGKKPRYALESAEAAKGCTDKSLPLEDRPIKIPYSLYFALPNNIKSTSNWGIGGVAFISNTESEDLTVGRMWKVTRPQFEEIWTQEGRGWYNEKIELGTEDGLNIYTITNKIILNNILAPSVNYLKTIKDGLRECSGMTSEEIANYLIAKKGIKEFYRKEELINI